MPESYQVGPRLWAQDCEICGTTRYHHYSHSLGRICRDCYMKRGEVRRAIKDLRKAAKDAEHTD